MKNQTKLQFSVKDNIFDGDLSPSNITLPLASEFIQQVMNFIRGSRKIDLNHLKTSIKKGSLIVEVEDKNNLLTEPFRDYEILKSSQDMFSIDLKRAEVIKTWQKATYENESRRYKLSNGDKQGSVSISKDTAYKIQQDDIWVDVELYIRGEVYDMGGKNKANVHVKLENGKTIKAGTEINFLQKQEVNRLYRRQLLRIKAKQNVVTKELKEEKLISFEKYSEVFDEDEYEKIAKKTAEAWKSVPNASDWVEEIRGNS